MAAAVDRPAETGPVETGTRAGKAGDAQSGQARSGAVELVDIVKRYGDLTAVHKSSLSIEPGTFLTLLGPSGCGKTTTLRMIAGLTGITEGNILISGRRVNDLPIHKRNLGIVFQNYALFPHKTIFDNIAFGLKYRNTPKAEIRKRVMEVLDLVQLPHLADRMPAQLSGGQQQRIALARAIVIQPDVLLLDEPLSALDANLREDMRVELKRIQHEVGITTVFVTHDQSEALALSDRIVVMSNGRIEQVGAPAEVYNRPSSAFVATFLGNANILDARLLSTDATATGSNAGEAAAVVDIPGIGRLSGVAIGGSKENLTSGNTVSVAVRAEKLSLDPKGAAATDETDASFQAKVTAVDYQGQAARYFLDAGNLRLQALNAIDDVPVAEGATVMVRLRARDAVVLPPADA
ncbi:ABC transporter ATP-binding protein [Fodinicurvata sp. EGI_FJ10296]|uniref:ABC transporter ATP-binding protein n=1 Tax=Fodinicurvata sp. EGI_FJ10296 TaxID=3231908 RepID=UPI00345543A3